MDKFYITTPIYYVNDKPHIGHAYTTILADVLSRFSRSLGRPTFFLTGTDEHGQKVQKAAEAGGVSPQKHADDTVVRFQELWKKLEITNDRFIRTTSDYHKKAVQQILQDLYDRGEIYKDEYEGHYCVGDERFFNERDLVDGKCPECGRDVTKIIESNYFFRMSSYQEWLIDYIKTHPKFIQPSFRANETLGFLRKPLEDLCISRPKSRLNWGIELPFDSDYVCYVWFDALLNYVTGVGYLQNENEFNQWWPAECQLIGKDILTTHTVYWPTMLKAIGLPMPKTVFAHGWWLTGRDKMSKSLGNVVNPMDMIDLAGVDSLRYFLMAEMSLGQDASFTEETFVARYNSDLANDLGNLLSRVTKLISRSTDGVIPVPGEFATEEKELFAAFENAKSEMTRAIDAFKLDQGINAVMNGVRTANRYLEQTAPWALAKKGEIVKLNTVLFTASEALRQAAVLLTPVMPTKMKELAITLGLSDDYTAKASIASLKFEQELLAGCRIADTTGLFKRIEREATGKEVAPAKAEATETPVNVVDMVTIDEFFRTKLKTAKVLAAEKIEGADKLLKLKIEIGDETRQLVAGIALYYSPESLIGRNIVVVSNLKPAKIRGIDSQGMLLAAKNGNELKLITVDGQIASGSGVG